MMDFEKTIWGRLGYTLVIVGVLGGCASPEPARRNDPPEVTIRCPVSDTDTDPRAAETAEYGGKVYYFCCAGCKEEFERNPIRYTSP